MKLTKKSATVELSAEDVEEAIADACESHFDGVVYSSDAGVSVHMDNDNILTGATVTFTADYEEPNDADAK